MDTLAKGNKISPVALLVINLVVACLVLVAHGGFLLLVRAGKAGGVADGVTMTYFTIPAALLIVVTAIAALAKPAFREAALKVQAVLLGIGALSALYYGAVVALEGVPRGVNFGWNPVFYALCVGYPVYLVQRTFSRPQAPPNALALQAPLWAMGIAILISVVIMWRVWNVAT